MNEYGTLTSTTNNRREQFTGTPSNGSSGGTKVVTITCAWTDRATHTPSMLSAFESGSDFLLTNVDRQQLPAGLCQITLTYSANSTSATVPATTYSEQSSQIEVDIREHPDFADWASDWDDEKGEFKPGTTKYGIKSYIKGSTTVTVTVYSTSKPGSAKGDIGTLESPGSDYGSSDNWLLVGANRSKQGLYWTMQKVYLYSAKAWDADIYD